MKEVPLDYYHMDKNLHSQEFKSFQKVIMLKLSKNKLLMKKNLIQLREKVKMPKIVKNKILISSFLLVNKKKMMKMLPTIKKKNNPIMKMNLITKLSLIHI